MMSLFCRKSSIYRLARVYPGVLMPVVIFIDLTSNPLTRPLFAGIRKNMYHRIREKRKK